MSRRRLLSHGQRWPGLALASEGCSGAPRRLVPQEIAGVSLEDNRCQQTARGAGLQPRWTSRTLPLGRLFSVGPRGGGGELLEPRRLGVTLTQPPVETMTQGRFHPCRLHSLGGAKLSVARVRGQVVAGSGVRTPSSGSDWSRLGWGCPSGSQPGGASSLSPQKPPTLMSGTVEFCLQDTQRPSED